MQLATRAALWECFAAKASLAIRDAAELLAARLKTFPT